MDKNTKNMLNLYPKNVSKSCFKQKYMFVYYVYWAQKNLALPAMTCTNLKPVFKFITCLIMFTIFHGGSILKASKFLKSSRRARIKNISEYV